MEEKYLYRSALEYCWLSVPQIQERIQKNPFQKHELWQQGWTEWKDWRSISHFSLLNEELPREHYHYIGPSGRDYISRNEIIAHIRSFPQKHHRLWKKGWKSWKHWFEEDFFAQKLSSLIPKPNSEETQKSQTSNHRHRQNRAPKNVPTLHFSGMWNLQEQQWLVLSQEDHSIMLDELQNTLPNIKWIDNWIDNVVSLFWTSILDCCFGIENGNGELSQALRQQGSFRLPKVCSFYPSDPLHKGCVLHIKTSQKIQAFFSGDGALPSLGDQTPFRNTNIWTSIMEHAPTQSLSRRRRLSWVIYRLTQYDIIRISQILASYERLMLNQLHEKGVFELGELGKLTLRKAKTQYHIGLVPSNELLMLVNQSKDRSSEKGK